MQKGYHKWTKAEHRLLVQKYPKHGDVTIAAMMEERFPKGYPWTRKHIEKRRKYHGLKRTAEQEHRLRVLNNGDGRHYRMWDTRGRAKEGEVRHWRQDGVTRAYIKVNGKFMDYYRHKLKAKPGQVARHHEGKLRLITKGQNGEMNRKLWMNYSPELKQTVKVLNKLTNLLNGKANARPARRAL